MSSLSILPNVGKVLLHNLNQIGIETPEQLRETGAKEAFIRIRGNVDAGACLHMLYGIQGAAEGISDKYLDQETRSDLKNFFKSL